MKSLSYSQSILKFRTFHCEMLERKIYEKVSFDVKRFERISAAVFSSVDQYLISAFVEVRGRNRMGLSTSSASIWWRAIPKARFFLPATSKMKGLKRFDKALLVTLHNWFFTSFQSSRQILQEVIFLRLMWVKSDFISGEQIRRSDRFDKPDNDR